MSPDAYSMLKWLEKTDGKIGSTVGSVQSFSKRDMVRKVGEVGVAKQRYEFGLVGEGFSCSQSSTK